MLDELAERRDEREPWRLRAACRGMGWEHFFPVPAQGRPRRDREPYPATLVCAECPVTAECDATRQSIPDVHGIWAGVRYRNGKPMADTHRRTDG